MAFQDYITGVWETSGVTGHRREYHDVEGAGLYLRGRADVDPKRIGLWGGSYGGYLTAMGLSRGSDLFAAGGSARLERAHERGNECRRRRDTHGL
jgi:dienelactone hydrolase